MGNIIQGGLLATVSSPMLAYTIYILVKYQEANLGYKAMGGLLMLGAFSALMTLTAVMLIMLGIRDRKIYSEATYQSKTNGMVRLQDPISLPTSKYSSRASR